jgi:V8-like Glu-specific endopeptidase
MTPGRRLLTLATLCLALTAPAAADPANRPQMAPSRIADSLDAVARIRGAAASRGGCTAVLITPDRALTAAHCARGPTSGPNAMTLVFRPGAPAPLLRAPVRAVQFHVETAALTTETAHADLALLHLATPVPDDLVAPIPLAETDAAPDRISIYGYLNPQTDLLHGHDGCALAPLGPALYGSDCRVVSGLSGAPALSGEPGAWRVEGITVATVSSPPLRALIADVVPWPNFAAE